MGGCAGFACHADGSRLGSLLERREGAAQGIFGAPDSGLERQALGLAGHLPREVGAVALGLRAPAAFIERAPRKGDGDGHRERRDPARPPRLAEAKKLTYECSHP